jgi:hypothetical protein
MHLLHYSEAASRTVRMNIESAHRESAHRHPCYAMRASTASRKRAYARPHSREVYHLPSGTGLVKGVTVELDVVTHVPVEFTCYPPHAGIRSYPY